MRTLSSSAHRSLMVAIDPAPMTIDDPVLPAVSELIGPGAFDILQPAVVAAGGILHGCDGTQVHYVPGRELVVRYDCDVTWGTGRERETLLAATTHHGLLPGAVPITAETATRTLEVSVWRWPFDPIVIGLPMAATSSVLAEHLGDVLEPPVTLGVVAYRPTERAVVRVVDAHGRETYLKAVPPADLLAIVAKHQALRDAGVPAPEVLFIDEVNGLLLLDAMPGTTLRDRIKSGHPAWPDPAALSGILDRLASVQTSGSVEAVRASRTSDAIAHARMLSLVAPEHRRTLSAFERCFEEQLDVVAARSGSIVHGDLHESQLFVDDDGAITGLIDLDDLGPGDPLDDPAVLLGHLEYRAITASDPELSAGLERRLTELRQHFADLHGARALELAVAAVLVGLATGPFRLRLAGWERLTDAVLAAAHQRAFDRQRT